MPRKCSVSGCDRPHDAKGFCKLHYMRSTRGTAFEQPLQVRSVTTKQGEPVRWINEVALHYAGDDCLTWPFSRSKAGYPLMAIDKDTNMVASRYLCQLAHGAPPAPEYEAAFTCANGHKGCMNPNHLVWRTFEENMRVRVAEGRTAKGPQMPQSKLSEDKVRRIRKLYPSHSKNELARMYNVARTTIHNVIIRKKWAWVAD